MYRNMCLCVCVCVCVYVCVCVRVLPVHACVRLAGFDVHLCTKIFISLHSHTVQIPPHLHRSAPVTVVQPLPPPTLPPPRQGANCSVTSTRLPARTQCTVMVGSRKRCSLASFFVYIFFLFLCSVSLSLAPLWW